MTHPTQAPPAFDGQVVELRQYTLHRGRRAELVSLFEREFIEPQQAVGLQVLGLFVDADDADHFVWFRGFADMAARGRGLPAFYGGPVWQPHRDAANATMIDSDNVLLLRPVTAWPSGAAASGAWFALLCPLAQAPDEALRQALREHGACWLETETAENDFPRLPVCSGETFAVGLAQQPVVLPAALQARLAAPPQTLRLLPTPRSTLR